jgi:hypothetical protein
MAEVEHSVSPSCAMFDHYRYDPSAFMSKRAANLDHRRRDDPSFDHLETLSGMTSEPRHRAKAASVT